MGWILAPLLALLLAAWFWYENIGAREQAEAICRAACKRLGVQFLDDTVSLRRMRPGRSRYGHVTLLREYAFEYSPDGLERRRGHVMLREGRVEWIETQEMPGREYMGG